MIIESSICRVLRTRHRSKKKFVIEGFLAVGVGGEFEGL
jgi:hypothetical protein